MKCLCVAGTTTKCSLWEVSVSGGWTIFFTSITFGNGFFQFQDNKVSLKQAACHNHENTT